MKVVLLKQVDDGIFYTNLMIISKLQWFLKSVHLPTEGSQQQSLLNFLDV